jgi:outer membrane protein OmpA-like peptidoglycan-associated protein
MQTDCLPGPGKKASRCRGLLTTTVTCGLLAAFPVAAQQTWWNALPVTGLYVGTGAGINFLQETDLDQSGSVTAGLRAAGFPAPNGKATFDVGIATVGSVGWGFGNGLRVEGEFSYRWNEVDRISGFGRLGPRLSGAGGQQQTIGLMANLLYDFQIPGSPWAVPYLGAGLGVAWTDWSGTRTRSMPANLHLDIDGTEFNFAYQAIAGVAFPIRPVPGLAITAEYRFFGTLANKYDATARTNSTGAVLARGSVEAESYNHSILAGVRYNFGRVPPPPPPLPAPAVAPAPARTYLVFFDWDRADLTARAREIIAEAVVNVGRVQSTRIEVAGHADRSGTPLYNERLSRRRAEAVAAELVSRGIGRGDILVTAFGESRPLVPTADGVREPQNRRVEIVLR